MVIDEGQDPRFWQSEREDIGSIHYDPVMIRCGTCLAVIILISGTAMLGICYGVYHLLF